MECSYYFAARDHDSNAFDRYIDFAAERILREKGEQACSEFRAEHTYDRKIVKLAAQIRAYGGYNPDAGTLPAWGNLLEDGHHRAAVICAIYGPDYKVPVSQSLNKYPDDIDLCARECRSTPSLTSGS
jgi:hypothetical protein